MELALGALNKMDERYDKFAIMLSGICALHCIITPLVASVIPLFSAAVHHGEDAHDFWFHQFILIFILPISLIALATGFRAHQKILPLIVAGMGLLILTFTALFAEHLLHNHVIEHEGETLLTITGGVIHAIGHIMNVLAARKKHTHCSSA